MALRLNGTDAFLELASAVKGSFPVAFSAWVSQDTVAGDRFAVTQSGATTDDAIAGYIQSNANQAAFQHIPGNTAQAVKSVTPFSSPTVLRLMVCVFNSATSRSIYFGSNTPVTDTGSLADTLSTHTHLVIGAGQWNNTAKFNFWNGCIAEVHFFDPTSWSGTTQIDALLAGGSTLPESVTGWIDGWALKTLGSYTSIGGTRTLAATGGVTQESTIAHPVTRTVPGTTINCTVGNAVAAGYQATIQKTVTINATTGNAIAAGLPATITNGAAGTTINCSVGNATAGGYTANFGTYIQSDVMVNNTNTVLANTAVNYTWTPNGRVGSMTGLSPVDGTGTTDVNGRFAPGIVKVPGKLDIAVRATGAVDDAVYSQGFA